MPSPALSSVAPSRPATRHLRRASIALLGLVLLSTVLTGCTRARVGQRCTGTGWAEDGGAWILRCQKGRYVRVLTKARYVRILLANQPGGAGGGGGTTTTTPGGTTPTTTIPPVPLTATQISGGYSHSCARIANGTLRCWGDGFFGQLGNGTFGNASRAGDVSGVADASEVSAGGNFTCAVRTGGAVWCWGDNKGGELGNGQLGNISTPVQLSGIAGATSIDTGYGHACATFTQGGTTLGVSCWGSNGAGQLGPAAGGLEFNQPTVVTGLSGIAQVATGGGQSCALRADATVVCWGANDNGELGRTTGSNNTPTPGAVTGLTGVRSITAGRKHTCALKVAGPVTSGTVWCWGEGANGKLGNGGTSDSTTPVQVTGLTDATAVSAGEGHTCALRATGTVVCWGRNDLGQLGTGNVTPATTPVGVVQLGGVDAMDVGDFHSCAHLAADNTVRCWGSNTTGQLGNLTNDNSSAPVIVVT